MTTVEGTRAVPLAHTVLRILIVANWLYGAAIFVLLVAMPTRPWIISALGLSPSPEAERVIAGLYAIAVIGLVAVPVFHIVLRRLLAIVETVRAGEPFAAANASRLETVAWALLALQVLSIVIGGIGRAVSTPAHPLDIDAGFSVGGWLTVLMTFVLARVFRDAVTFRACARPSSNA